MPVDDTSEESSRRRNNSNDSDSSSSSSSSLFSEDASSTSMPAPPDGGYGWVIIIAAFLINLICDGISFSFGILYTELLDQFQESKSLTSWVGSLFYGTCLMGGPLASGLATKFGCRKVLIGGGIVASAGTFISAFATSIGTLCLFFGVITGIGMSMGYVTSVVMVAFYFENKRALATGLAVCGSGIGTFVFAPLTELFIDIYGWRGTMIIWSGIILNLVVCGALLRPLEFTVQEKRQKALLKFEKMSRMSRTESLASSSNGRNVSRLASHTEGLEDEDDIFEEGNIEDCCHSQIQIPTFIKEKGIEIPVEVLKEAKNNRSALKDYIRNYCEENDVEPENQQEDYDVQDDETKYETTVMLQNGKGNVKLNGNIGPKSSCLKNAPKKQQSNEGHHHSKSPSRPKKQVRMSTYLPLYRKGLFFRGNLTRYTGPIGRVKSSSCPELTIRQWDDSDSESSDDDDWDFPWRYLRFSKHMKRVLKALFDPTILKNPLYVVFAISNFILYFWYDVPYIFLVDRATELGMDENKASLLISILGIVNTVGQILYGIIGDREVNLSVLYGISLMACGLSIFVVPIFTAFEPQAVISGLFGLFISHGDLGGISGHRQTVKCLWTDDAALFYDFTGSYDLTFYIGGGFIVFSGAMLLVVPIMRRCQKPLKFEQQACSSRIFNESHLAMMDREIVIEMDEGPQLPNGNETTCSSELKRNG
ncbi:MOT12-like protein [Mya arenaria]|uniref:MOT12-like protein n=1 Tax=Mya arenaria TaxID=6604 RepID=A0ABY7DCB8_MYAAR|nr:MOT12-like protein [Mya arenaria]